MSPPGWPLAGSAGHALALALAEGAAILPGQAQDCRILFAAAAGKGRDQLHRLDLPDFTQDLRAAYLALLARRAAGEPVSKILGYRDFWKHRFRVTPDVLDPRPETEILVARALVAPFQRVLDLGTGTGAILLSLLAERPAARGVGADLSPAALAVARGNAQDLGLQGRADFLVSDWFSAIEGQFDLIVSNPPYIALDEMADLSVEVRAHDPRMALTDESDGLSVYRILAREARAHLTPGGRLLLEIGPSQGQAVAGFLRAAGFEAVEILSDLDGRDRVLAATSPGAAV